MKFTATRLNGAYVVEIEPIEDNRGFFSRTWCQREFEAHKLASEFVQTNITYSPCKGTVRGFHYQIAPHKEVKLVRCVRGAIYDVIIDLRPDSPTFGQWLSSELTAENRKMLYIPGGFAHGYQTIVDDTEVFYQVAQFWAPDFERGIRWNDPVFAVTWPITNGVILSDKDKAWPDFRLKEGD